MKIDKVPGEFAFKALIHDKELSAGFILTDGYYFSLNEVIKKFPSHIWNVKWPVEIWEDGTAYVAAEEEMK